MISTVSHWIVSPFSKRRMMEAAGLCLALLALTCAGALLSYHASDPSFNQLSDAPIRNAMGAAGAIIADVMLQVFGWVSGFIVLAFLGWSWRLIRKEIGAGIWIRLMTLMLCIIAFSMFFALIDAKTSSHFWHGAGGSLGIIGASQLVPVLGYYGLIALSFTLGLISLPFALGLKFNEWVALGMVSKLAFETLSDFIKQTVQFLRHSRSHEEEEIDDNDDSDYESLQDVRDTHQEPRFVEAPKKRVEPKKTRKVDVQSSLELNARKGDYELPSLSLLNKVPAKRGTPQINEAALEQNARMLESVLKDFGVQGEITRVRPGPVVTLYELEPAPGIKSSRVIGLADDIARSMSAVSARIAVIPARNAIGIELPNAHRDTVYMREMIEDETYENTECKLPLVLGKDIGGEAIIADLARMPHLLVAGTTGSGKSVAINTMITSLLYHLTPDQCRFIMIDPKMLELSVYDNIPHLLAPVVTEPGKAVVALKWTVKEMENRYRLMSNLGVRNIEGYNKRIEEAKKKGEILTRLVQTGFDAETGRPITEKVALEMNTLPFIVVIVDEMADLMLVAGKDIESSIQRLAQMARAAGIHIIMATQRPSVDVITGVIKANFPTRISFQVTSKIDSRTILGEQGAEQLLGQGDMLYMAGGGRITRVHGPFIADKEVEKIVDFLKTQGAPQFDEAITRDDSEEMPSEYAGEDESDAERALYQQAMEIVLREQKASTSYIQRRLKIGYNRAARIIEKMEQEGLVGAPNHVGKREVLVRS